MATLVQRPLPVRGRPSPRLPVQGRPAPRREPRPGAIPARVTPGRVLELGLGALALGGVLLQVHRQPATGPTVASAAAAPPSRLALDCLLRQWLGWLLAHAPGGALVTALLGCLPRRMLTVMIPLALLLAALLAGPALPRQAAFARSGQRLERAGPVQELTLAPPLRVRSARESSTLLATPR